MVKEMYPAVQRVVTATSRKPRSGEVNGKDYYFFTPEDFMKRIENNEFYEHAKVHGHFYGVLKKEIEEKLTQKIDLLLNIDVQGAATMRAVALQDPLLSGRIVSVFVTPPNIEELKRRMEKRGGDSPEEIARRLVIAEEEILEAQKYDHRLLSTPDREHDFLALKKIYYSEKEKS